MPAKEANMDQAACHLCQERCDCQRCKLQRAAPRLLDLLACLTGYVEARQDDGARPYAHAEEARALIGQLR